MLFCTNCGARLPEEGDFCPSCGVQKGAAQNPSGQQGAYQQHGNQQQYGYGAGRPVDDIADNKGICILCYLGLLFLIPYLTRPDSDYVKFHSNQGLVLFLFCVALGFVSWIPFLGWLAGFAGSLFAAVCLIMGIVNALNGDKKELPLIGQITILN